MVFRYSLSKYIAKTYTGYYSCFDIRCGARGIMKFNFNDIKNKDFHISQTNTNDFYLTKKHTKKYEDHSYKRNQIIKYDLDNNDVTVNKLENLEYYKNFLKEYCLKNISFKKDLIYQKLIETYGEIKIKLTKDQKNNIIKKYKNSHNITEEEFQDIEFKDIFNNKILFERAMNVAYKSNRSKKFIKELILNIQDFKGYNITTEISVKFKRKNKIYKKPIYLLMNASMKDNIQLIDNIQYFGDTTFDVIPPQNKGMKLFVVLAYNKKFNSINLCVLALIYNENQETIEAIFNFLKINYNFYPKLFTVDFGKAGYLVLQHVFPKTRIFTCYFHLIRRLIIHLKNLRSKNKIVKRNAKNLLFNFKLLIFIDSDKIVEFFNKIKEEYYNNHKKFIDYFEKQYFKNSPFKDKQWNYSNYLKSDEDTQKYFYSNNVAESLNRTLKSFYKYSNRNFYNFQICINKIIELYETHNDYIKRNISITRVFAWYCKNFNIDKLMNYKDIEYIINEYKENFNYDITIDDINDVDDSDENIKKKKIYVPK